MISKYSSRINSVWQMRKIKIARYLLISLIFISLFFISSCAWFGGNDIPVFPTATISGAIRIEGAVPSEILSMMNTSSERTVVPSAFGTGTVSYTCEVKDSDDNTIPAGSYAFNTESDDSGNVYYTITGLPLTASPQTLKLTITLIVGGTNEVLRSTEQELEGLSLTQPAFQKNIVLRPISEGSGSYSLTVNLDSSINISTETYKLYLYLYDPADPTNTSKIKDEYKQLTSNSWGWSGSLPSGTYKAIISLYKVVGDTEYLMYQFEEIVNIFKNLATNTWLKHSAAQEYIDDSVTPAICKITAGCISNFLSTNIYVDSSTTVDAASQTGSYLAPFKDINKAVNYIKTISASDSTATYTIHIKNLSTFILSSGITVDRNITVKCWSTTPGDVFGSAYIQAGNSFSGTSLFTINNGKNFIIPSRLTIDGNNKNINGVTVSNGRLGITGGASIKKCSTGIYLAEKTDSNIISAQIISGTISGNKCGIYVTSSDTLEVGLAPCVKDNFDASGNKKDIYLPDGKTFKIYSEFNSYADIWVSTETAATLETKVSIATGYSDYHATATNPPSAYIHSDLGDPIIYNATTSTVQIAKNGGSIKNSYDVKFSFAASSTLMAPDTAKAITITPTITTKNASGTTIPLYYKAADQKLYLDETFTTLYLPDNEASPDYNKVTWNAALYNNGVKLSSYEPTVEGTDPANKFTVPALPEEKYNLKITATYLGIKHDVEFGIIVKLIYTFSTEPNVLPSGTNGTAGTGSTYIYFGDWPQTIKADNVEIYEATTKEQGAFTYCLGSDGNWYYKCLENAYATGYTYSNGSTVAKANVNSYKYFKAEPIKWRVLTTDYNGSGKWLILAESALTANVPYYDSTYNKEIDGVTVYANDYKESSIRAYLNGLVYTNQSSTSSIYSGKGFLQTAFTSDAQSKIAETTVINDGNSTSDATGALIKADGSVAGYPTNYTCANTQDKVFLLSLQEVTTTEYGFGGYSSTGDTSKRVRSATDFAKANYANGSTDFSWWLRTPHYSYNDTVRTVNYEGNADYSNSVDNKYDGVVPAICIDAP